MGGRRGLPARASKNFNYGPVGCHFGFVVLNFWFKLRTAEFFGVQPRGEASAEGL